MVNVNKLRGKIVEKETDQESVARAIGMHRSTFYRKMKSGGTEFTIGEIQNMVKAIPLTNSEAMEIFFNNTVA